MSAKQYTIRSVSEQIDRELRRRAAAEQKSLNAVILEVLERELGSTNGRTEHNDLDFLIGSWEHDPAFDSAISDFGHIEQGVWQ